jgi:hypothetical protein
MSAGVEFDIRGIPEVKEMLGQVSERELRNRTRRALRASAAVFRTAMRSKRGGANWPKRPKTFYKTRTRNHRIPLGVSVNPQSPLSSIFEHGARPHAIPITTGPSAGRTVQHPGVSARPFVGPIFDAERRAAEEAFADKLLEGID